MSSFNHLHLHTHYSLLDSSIRIDELMEYAAQDKMQSIAITDHGNMFGVLDFYSQAKDHGIKPIIGCEVYIAPGNRTQKGTTGSGDEDAAPYATMRSGLSHLVLLAMDDVGYLNLCKLVSSGFLEGFYYKPRIDKEILSQHADGLIALSACLKGEVTNYALIGDMDRAKEAALWYKGLFKDRFYLEMQSTGLPQNMIVNQRFQELAKDLSIPLVATNDCHYLKKEDAFPHDVLLHIQTGKQVEDPSGSSLKTDEYYVKPQAKMIEDFAFCPEAIENTIKIADRCKFEYRFNDETGKKIYHFPKFEPPHGKNQQEFLRENAVAGLEKRILELEEIENRKFTDEDRKKYQDRLERELKVIIDMGFTGYFLIVADFIGWAKDHGVPVGPGRGSGAGCLVAYSLRITELDPIANGCLFERFLNPERVSLPDFDVDFCMDKRGKVIEYVNEKYGKDSVAQIITFGKLQARGVIRDVGRAFGMLPVDVDKIAKLVPETLNITLEEAFEVEPRLRELTDTDERLSRLFQVCRSLEGLGRHASIHAAGLVISNRPMVEHCPLYRGKNDELVIQFDMNNADKIGLIKFDFLGLKTLTFLEAAEKLINERHPQDGFRLSRINFGDKKMYEMLCKGDTNGVFQLESSGMQDMLKKSRPDRFADIVALISLYRPGPMEMLDDFIGRKHGQIPIDYMFEELRPILQETYGIMVYQEQVQQIAMKLAGYTAGGADLLRRAMGKKKPEEMAKQKKIFLEGAVKNGHDQAKAEKLFDLMAKFAGYGFNKSHAAAYSVITCQTGFIKAHYPVEYYACLLSIERENTDKITKYIADAKNHNIAVFPPDINESETDFTVLSENQIRFGLGAIKGVGQIAIDSVLEARKKGGPFTDLFDLCARTNGRTVNKRVLEAFVKAGALDSFKVHRASLFKAIDTAIGMGSSLQKTMDEAQHSFADLLGEDSTFSHRKVEYPDETPWLRLEELRYEKDVTGFFMSGHPLDAFEDELHRYTTATIAQCLEMTSPKEVFIGAEIASRREIITKRGDRMAFLTLEDTTGQIDTVVFSDAYLENEALFKSNEPLWIKASLEHSEGTSKLLLSKKKTNCRVLPLRYAYEALARELHLYVNFFDTPEKKNLDDMLLKSLQSYVQSVAQPGGAPLFVHLLVHDKAKTVLKMKETIPMRRDTIDSIKGIFGNERYRLEFR